MSREREAESGWGSVFFVVFLLWGLANGCYHSRGGAVPAEPQVVPLDPAGLWVAKNGGSVRYIVSVEPAGRDRWTTTWHNQDNVLCYAGVLEREGAKFKETYDPAVSRIGPWMLAESAAGLDCYPVGGMPGSWTLERAVEGQKADGG